MSKGMNKEEAILTLKESWGSISAQAKKDLITSLMGHRLKFSTIAAAIDRSVQEVKDAWQGIVEVPTIQIPSAAPIEPTFDPQFALPEDCGNSYAYKGILPPTCCNGGGCQKCWAIFNTVNGLDSASTISSVAAEVTPLKNLYTLTFDEILQKYRDYIDWSFPDIKLREPKDVGKYVRGAIVSDIHAPYQDDNAFAAFINDVKVNGHTNLCILGGDGGDFHNYSKYAKYGQHFSVQQEHKAVASMMAILSETFDEVVVIPGNHDERTRKKYATLLPADLYQALLDFHGGNTFDFIELISKQFENVFIPEFPKHGYAEYKFIYQFHDIIVGHPEVYSRIPNKSVGGFIDWLMRKAMPLGLINEFQYAVMGHTHMAGKTFNDFSKVGIENGCLAITPDYDSNAKLMGAYRTITHGYTRFATNVETGKTHPNDINFIALTQYGDKDE